MVFHIYYGLHMAILWTVSTDQDYKFFPRACSQWIPRMYCMESFEICSENCLGAKVLQFWNPNNSVDDVFGSIPWILFVYIEEKFHDFAMYILPVFLFVPHTILDHYCTVWNKKKNYGKMTYCFQNMRKGLSGVVH